MIDPSLVGTWTYEEARPFAQRIVFTLYPDGRAIQFYRQAESLSRVVTSTLHISSEAGRYRATIRSSAPGYFIAMFREGDDLVIENNGRRTVLCRLLEPDLPDWYSEAAERAVWR